MADALAMTRIAHNLTEAELRNQPCLFSIINTNSPLQLDIPMMQGIMALAEMGQIVVITPFTLAGAMAPVTVGWCPGVAKRRGLGGYCLYPDGKSRGSRYVRWLYL